MLTVAFWTALLQLSSGGLLVWSLVCYTHRWFFNNFACVPGPFIAKFSDIWGFYYSLKGDLHLRLQELHEQHGPVVRVGPNKLSFNTETALHEVYMSKDIQKARGYGAMRPKGGSTNTITTIDKEIHRFKRKVISHGLSESSMRAFEPTMNRHVDIFLKRLLESCVKGEWSEEVDMSSRFRHLSYDIMSHYCYGRSFEMQSKPDNRFIIKAIRLMSILIGGYLQFGDLAKAKLHLLFARKILAVHKPFQVVTNQLTDERVARGQSDEQDLLSFIIDAKDEETGRSFALHELWGESRTLLIAGSDTNSTTMAALVYYLSRYPKCYEKLVREIRETFGSASEIGSGEKMNACTYLRACIDETLRITPPVGSPLWREVSPHSGGIKIDGIFIPEGAEVGVGPYLIHHNKDYFPDPYLFDPERWIVSDTNSREQLEIARKTFSAFSLGTRGCAGRAMAYMELCKAIAKTLWYFDFECIEGANVSEYRLEDHFISTHSGPDLRFKARADISSDLENLACEK